jgi:serine/threonine-protein kinase
MVGSFGEVYLLDWGIAIRIDRAAPSETLAGTPGYLPPEMAVPAQHRCDARTDVYLLGATLHHVLTRRLRHQGQTLSELLDAARRSEPVVYGPEVPEELAAICNRATAADPAERFASAAVLRDALSDFLHHRGAVALCDRASERLQEARTLLSGAGAGIDPGKSISGDADGIHDRVRTLLFEVRFGYEESLREWPDFPRARAGLRECLITGVEQELLLANLPGARALLEQVKEPPAELVAQVAELRQQLKEQRSRAARLEQLEKGRDWRVGSVPRLVVVLAAWGLAVLLWRIVMTGQHAASQPIPPLTLALGMAGMLAGCGLLLLIFRRHLFSTEVNRQIALGFLCCLGGMTMSRALHMIPTSRTGDIICMDQVLAATVAAVGGVVLARWLWLLSPVLLLGALTARLRPSEDGISMLVSGAMSVLIGIIFLARTRVR